MGTDQTAARLQSRARQCAEVRSRLEHIGVTSLQAVRVIGWAKGGDSVDYHASFIVAPKAKLAVTVTGIAPLSSTQCETLGERILLHALVEQRTLYHLPVSIPAVAPPVSTATTDQLAAMEGFYAMNQAVFHITPSENDPQSLTFSTLTPDGWARQTKGLRLRTDGSFHADGSADSLTTVTAGGRQYLVRTAVGGYGHYLDSSLLAQKLMHGEELSAMWQGRVGRLWLAANEQPDSATYSDDGGPLLVVGDAPGLTGYVTVTTGPYGTQVVDPSISDALGAMLLQIPGMGSRDLEDAVVERHGSKDWIRFGSTLYRPEDAVSELAAGPNSVTFAHRGARRVAGVDQRRKRANRRRHCLAPLRMRT